MAMPSQESCLTCKHINKRTLNKCKAFPKGIPFMIVSGGIQHTKPIKGDNGIIYEQDTEAMYGDKA
jgi:hypothetical protein|tara:strand:- start:157 stop:354 length:198 start_codon:yes stop_codon:yes gene_type:complete